MSVKIENRKPKQRLKNFGMGMARIAVSIALYSYVISTIQWDSLPALDAGLDARWFAVPLLLALGGGLLVTPFRWRTILRSLDLNVRFFVILKYRLISFPMKTVLFGLAGDIIKSVMTARDFEGKPELFMTSVFYEKALALEAYATVAGVLYCAGTGGNVWKMALLAAIACFYFVSPWIINAVARYSRDRLSRWDRTNSLLAQYAAISHLRHFKMKFAVLAEQLTYFSLILACMKCMGIAAPFSRIGWAAAVALLVGAFPISFGGLGTRETALVVLLSNYVAPAKLVAAAGLYFFVDVGLMLLISLPVSVYYIVTYKIKWRGNADAISISWEAEPGKSVGKILA